MKYWFPAYISVNIRLACGNRSRKTHADCVIRLFIAFGEWSKLNFNVLLGNFISPCYQLILNDTEVRKIYRLHFGRSENCWHKWPQNINWPSGPIFVIFDWPDREFTGSGPAVTSNPDKYQQMNKFTYNTVILLMSQNIIVKL